MWNIWVGISFIAAFYHFFPRFTTVAIIVSAVSSVVFALSFGIWFLASVAEVYARDYMRSPSVSTWVCETAESMHFTAVKPEKFREGESSPIETNWLNRCIGSCLRGDAKIPNICRNLYNAGIFSHIDDDGVKQDIWKPKEYSQL